MHFVVEEEQDYPNGDIGTNPELSPGESDIRRGESRLGFEVLAGKQGKGVAAEPEKRSIDSVSLTF